MKRYRAVFLAGDAVIESRNFYVPDSVDVSGFNGIAAVVDLATLMDQRRDLQDQYGCPVSVDVRLVETIPEPSSPVLAASGWLRRISSFFHF